MKQQGSRRGLKKSEFTFALLLVCPLTFYLAYLASAESPSVPELRQHMKNFQSLSGGSKLQALQPLVDKFSVRGPRGSTILNAEDSTFLTKEFLPFLIEVIRSDNVDTRYTGLFILWTCARQCSHFGSGLFSGIEPAVRDVLLSRDEDDRVRNTAALALQTIKPLSDETKEALQTVALTASDASVVRDSVTALVVASKEDRFALKLVMELTKDDSDNVKGALLYAARRIENPNRELVDYCLQGLQATSHNQLMDALSALRREQYVRRLEESDVQTVLQVINDDSKHEQVRVDAVILVAKIVQKRRWPTATQSLLEIIQDVNLPVAVRHIGVRLAWSHFTPSKEVRRVLTELLSSPEPKIAETANYSLERMRPNQSSKKPPRR